MSILQEYEEIRKELGNGINKGIELYLSKNPNLEKGV
ncbi:putative membrane protein [Faecalicoccus acidiformans]|uniref:Putative membrane protein n=1 Tax=Faecalicoccus acidiformans TaxID=915173 RepID=A0A7W8D0R3_9FIRM|nr:putative membrane protein [Faecalicoccus acidiformans]